MNVFRSKYEIYSWELLHIWQKKPNEIEFCPICLQFGLLQQVSRIYNEYKKIMAKKDLVFLISVHAISLFIAVGHKADQRECDMPVVIMSRRRG